jgi:uncharacterized protein (DUF1697 family)
MRYVAFLRGINVGGHTVKMAQLCALFQEMGFTRVSSYIQSGNIFFESLESDEQQLETSIAMKLKGALGYDVRVYVRTVAELTRIIARDPFRNLTVRTDMRACIVFLDGPIPSLDLPLFSPKRDMEVVAVSDREAYVLWYIVNGRPPASSAFLKDTLGDVGTTRFMHTAHKILAAAQKEG